VEPPKDADDWTEEQWRTFLNGAEDGVDPDRRVFAPRLSSTGGTILGAAMTGAFNAIYGEAAKPDIVIESEADGKDDGMKIDLDPEDPSQSTVVVQGKATSEP
jgi:hypothetical protein